MLGVLLDCCQRQQRWRYNKRKELNIGTNDNFYISKNNLRNYNNLHHADDNSSNNNNDNNDDKQNQQKQPRQKQHGYKLHNMFGKHH